MNCLRSEARQTNKPLNSQIASELLNKKNITISSLASPLHQQPKSSSRIIITTSSYTNLCERIMRGVNQCQKTADCVCDWLHVVQWPNYVSNYVGLVTCSSGSFSCCERTITKTVLKGECPLLVCNWHVVDGDASCTLSTIHEVVDSR